MALKLKIKLHYINDMTSPVILILPSPASSPSMRWLCRRDEYLDRNFTACDTM